MFFSTWSPGQEWNRFRGPNGTGKGAIRNIPNTITSIDFTWAVKINGFGHSSPVLWGDRLFITLTDDENLKGTKRKVQCYQAKKGDLLWEWTDPLEGHNLHKFNNFASSTPVADQDRVYLAWGSGKKTQVVALSHTGGLVWRKEWPGFSSDHGQASSPVLIDGVLVFHTDAKDDYKSYVLGLNPDNGEVLWQVERITPESDPKHFTAYNTPVSVKVGNINTVVALQSNDGWKGINPKDGSIVWSAPGGYKFRSVGSVAVEDGFLFASFGSGSGGKIATALRVGKEGAKELYSLGIKDGLSYVPTPLIHDNHLFLWADSGGVDLSEFGIRRIEISRTDRGKFLQFTDPGRRKNHLRKPQRRIGDGRRIRLV